MLIMPRAVIAPTEKPACANMYEAGPANSGWENCGKVLKLHERFSHQLVRKAL
jgi:hypothetical protein